MKSATWSSVHSMIKPVGLLLLSREWVNVVGVCSVLSGPELVGEFSYSGGSVGLMTLRSNSSSASESSWYLVAYAMADDVAGVVAGSRGWSDESGCHQAGQGSGSQGGLYQAEVGQT